MRNFVSHSHLSLKDTALLHQLDAIDWKTMKIRPEDGRLSKAEQAELTPSWPSACRYRPSPCWKRLPRLERLARMKRSRQPRFTCRGA